MLLSQAKLCGGYGEFKGYSGYFDAVAKPRREMSAEFVRETGGLVEPLEIGLVDAHATFALYCRRIEKFLGIRHRFRGSG